MRVRFTPIALGDLEDIQAYISRDNPGAARGVKARIRTAINVLGKYPELGRTGTIEGTRELVVPELPYVVVYQVNGDEVHILNVFHGARDRR